MLEHLEAANLFIVPIDSQRKWFRYHHLFTELLRQRLERRHPDLTPVLHLRASQWYAQEGLIDQAIWHALATTDKDYAASLIQQHAGDAFARGEFNLVLQWLQALPEALIHSRPLLCIMYAYAAQGDLGKTEMWMEAAQTALSTKSQGDTPQGDNAQIRDTVLYHLDILRALTARLHGKPRATIIELTQKALEVVPDSDPGTRSLLTMQQAVEYFNAGDYYASERALIESERLGERGGFYYSALASTYILGLLERRRGKLRDVAARCRKSLASIIEPIERSGRRMPVSGFIYFTLGCVLAEWNDFSSAEVALAKGIEFARLLPMDAAPIDGYFTLARIRIAQGDKMQVPDLDDLVAQNEGGLKVLASTVRARTWLIRSQREPKCLELALRWASERRLEPEEWDWGIFEQLTRARAFILQSRASQPTPGQPDLETVLDFLETQSYIAEQRGYIELWIDTLIVQALAFQALGNETQALNSIGRALTLAEPEGYARIFLDEGMPMKRLLYQAAQRGFSPTYAGNLLAAFDVAPATPAQAPPRTVRSVPLVESLTPREIEVLRLLAEGQSNREIAQKLYLSLSTVKRHNATIYGKLSVTSRTQAVARGRELGLL
jgi:LuxR family maltose regulon positive regulatory protein